MSVPDPKKIEKNWRARGFNFGIFEDPPGRCWEDYVHGEDELFMVLEGEVELEMEGEARIAGVGEEILITAGVTHSVRNIGYTKSRRPLRTSTERSWPGERVMGFNPNNIVSSIPLF